MDTELAVKPANLDFNQFFVKKAFENLESENNYREKDDDCSTNAPESRTISSNSVNSVFDFHKVKYFVKNINDAQSKENKFDTNNIKPKKLILKKRLDKFFNAQLDCKLEEKLKKHLL